MATSNLFDVNVLLQGVLSNLLFQISIFFFGKVSSEFRLYMFKLQNAEDISKAIKRLIFLIVLNSIFAAIIFYFLPAVFIHSLVISTFLLLFYVGYILVICRQFFKKMKIAGIDMVDSTVEKGIDYKQSLNLCQHSIKFLGIGAHKLTQLSEFQDAIRRCDSSGVAKGKKSFLICDPNSEALIEMERKNQRNSGNYKEKIISSLRKIKELRDQHIDIKLYLYKPKKIEDIPVFRLFFFDEDSVLVSFYAINQNNEEGKKLPQIMLSRTGASATFFYAFENYYEHIYSLSVECNDIDALISSIK